jgi:FO synthase
LCPDKLSSDEWCDVVMAAHAAGLPTTSTIMFGHTDSYASWAKHLVRLRAVQTATGGFTELVPLAFVHMEAPLFRRGLARRGPTLREAVLVHAVARLARLGIPNIQVSPPPTNKP